jgi:hypothetical protein
MEMGSLVAPVVRQFMTITDWLIVEHRQRNTQIFNFRVLKTEYPASIPYCLSMETRLCLFSVNKRLQNQKHPAQQANRRRCKYFFHSFNNIYTPVLHIDSLLKLRNITS